MKIEQLITMANQIGSYFEFESDREHAKLSIAQHLKKFWDPRMRNQMLAYVSDEQAAGLSSLVAEAIQQNADMLKPAKGHKG